MYHEILLCTIVIVHAKPSLIIHTIPSKAKVYSDSTFLGLTPLTIHDSARTVHTLSFVLEDYEDTTISIVGSPAMLLEDTTRLISVNAKSGIALTVESQEENAEIYVNDSLWGKDTVFQDNLTIGDYRIQITGYNIEPFLDTFTIERKEHLHLVVPIQKRHFTIMGVSHSRDFASFEFDSVPVVLEGSSFVLSSTESTRAQRDLQFYFGGSQDNNNSGVFITGHIPHFDTTIAISSDETDTLSMISRTWGVGIHRDYVRTIAAIENILRFDIGGMWGLFGKVRQFKYVSKKGSGGIGHFNLENETEEALAPIMGYVNVGGIHTRLMAGYKYAFVTLSYGYFPSLAFDGIAGYPETPLSYRGIHRLSIGVNGRF